MPKRKQAQEEEKPVYTLYEFINAEALKEIYEMNLQNDVEYKVVQLHNEVKKSTSQRIQVKYFNSEKSPEGRLFARGASTQGLKGWIRRCISWRNYIDLDFENCGPTLRLHLFESNGITKHLKTLRYLVRNRESFYQEIHREKTIAKDLTIKAMNGKGDLKNDLLLKFKFEMKRASEKFCKLDDHYGDWIAYRDENPEKHTAQKFFGRAVARIERTCLDCMVFHLQKTFKQTVGTLSFDGCTIELKEPYQGSSLDYINYEPKNEYINLCRDLEGKIKQEINVDISIKVKPLFLTLEEIEMFRGTPKVLKKIKPVTRVMPYMLSQEAMRCNLRRKNGFVMQAHPNVPDAWQQLIESKMWITSVLKDHSDFQVAKMQDLLTWFDNNDNTQFPILKDNIRYVAFKDKRFDLETLKCEDWDSITTHVDCPHYFDSCFEEKETPLWDSFLKFQLTPGCIRVTEILIGKLFYEVALHELWNVYLFILGYGNTGKSTFMHICERMFPAGSVGILSGATEPTFGMSTLLNKKCTMVYDVSENFHKCVNQQQYQGMISGDTLTIPVKYLDGGVTLRWKSSLLMAGNFLPGYVDKSGSIARRVFAAKFHKHIPGNVLNTNMQDDIIKNELVSVFIRCVKKYRAACEDFKGKDFWTYVAGPEFETMQKETARVTNNLACFLDDGNEETKVLYKEGNFVSLEQFQKLYNQHLEVNLKLRPERITDYSKFTERDYVVHACQTCTKCGKPANKKYCQCTGKKTRSVKMLIQHMTIQTFNGCNWETKPDNITFVRNSCTGSDGDHQRNETIAQMVEDAQQEAKSELDEKLAVAYETIEAQQLPQEEDPDDQQLGKDISENSNSQESQIMNKFFNAMGQNK